MAKIVKYYFDGPRKVYDVDKALKSSGWGITFEESKETKNLKVVDRNDIDHKATITHFSGDLGTLGFIYANFLGGGFSCLDHAIEQFKIDISNNNGGLND